MNQKRSLDLNMTVANLLDAWTQVIPVFFRYRMSCIGCSMALFETLQDVAHNYKIAPELFMLELLEVLPPAG